ncbi:hypothetical protein Vau01_096270 [Virgisporangium aurantiacum]|uniref:Uncharacterized protein n=1 Tax=Virgisporangium aurantiacum TaxID=175570 RepID=A0A8J4E5B8_9ACTN|nr:hypothetical protein Vau01_096270 [Virgisporangium aurantiacum]
MPRYAATASRTLAASESAGVDEGTRNEIVGLGPAPGAFDESSPHAATKITVSAR